jgi:DNA-binding response OmpR family regulator
VNIALVEDDPIQCKILGSWLEDAGHQCNCYATGEAFIASLDHTRHQMLLLDWELPDFSGMDLLRQLRQEISRSLPVMFITLRAEEADIVEALKSGADDYLVKPLRKQELLARIEALARRTALIQPSQGVQQVGPFSIDQRSRRLRRNGSTIELTQKEFGLATHLLGNIGRLLSRDELLEEVWGHATSLNTRTVDTHISRVRKKLELVPEQGWNLCAIYQHGYRLDRLDPGSAQE